MLLSMARHSIQKLDYNSMTTHLSLKVVSLSVSKKLTQSFIGVCADRSDEDIVSKHKDNAPERRCLDADFEGILAEFCRCAPK